MKLRIGEGRDRGPSAATVILLGIVCVGIASARISVAADTPAAKRPNLVAIVTDDQGRWAMGAYGNDEIHTPHMDRIGQEGALFTNAFVATPVCSPSRATYLTGRWPTELGITDWIAPNEADAGLGLHGPTWPEVLQQNGYRTALIGKWHLGTQPDFHPRKLGFDHFMGFLSGGTTPMNAVLEVGGKNQRTQGALPDVLTDDAIRFLHAAKSDPFALCLHFRAPHRRYTPVPAEDSAPYDKLDPTIPKFPGADVKQLKKLTRDYYGSVTSVDRNIGRLLETLDELKLSENTLVIFTSDHGYNEGRHGISTKGNGHWMAGGVNGPKRPNMWDTSLRVPLVARWPAVIRPGLRIDQLVSNIDMFRTVLGALSIEMPADIRVHGIDYSPLLRGQEIPAVDAVFGQYDLHNNGLAYLRMIRTRQFKYVRHFRENMMDELYDLEADPDEQRNLIVSRKRNKWDDTADSLRKKLTHWQESIDDPVLRDTY